MSAWDEQPEYQHEVADLETARLALRGAIQSVRSLQDLNGKLKGEVQDFLHREKALNERLIRLQTELNDSYARLDAETAHDREREAAVRETLRQEIVAEQNHKWQSEIDALRQSVQNWTEVRRQKETELKMLKETLLSKEQEVFTLQKEKIAAEENAHREILETIKRSREGVAASVEKAILTKEKEITDLQRKLAAQPKIIEERMQQIEQDLHRKEQSLLLQFRDRQQSLEMDWAHREKELWEKATEAREALEHELKSQWDERRKTLEETFQKRQTTLEIQAQQQFEEYQRRSLSRDEELHRTWASKEASLAQEWASREKEMARQFQATLDQERLRASEQAAQLKADTDLWRKNHDETLRRKEDDFNKAYVQNEQLLRNAYRKKEEDLLARHQEALELAQHQISELMTRTSDREGFAKVSQERLTNAVKERDALAARFSRLESDSAIRHAELEKAVEKRDEELARLNQTFTTQDESRISKIQDLERDQLHKDSELKVLREKILQAEADRKTSLEHAATLESEFATRQQQLEEAFRKETETLGERLAASSHESAERQQTDQRKIAELTAEAQQRAAEIHGLTHQLQLTRHDIEKITQDASDKQTKSLLIRRQLEERLTQREAELSKQIETLEKERFIIEERLDARVAELEQELGRRLSEDRALQERFRQSEEFRADAEKQAEELHDRLNAHEKQGNIREEEVRQAAEAAEKERIIAEQKLQLRIGELEASLVKQEGISTGLQEQLARSQADRQEDLQTAQMREARLETRAQALEQQLKAQEDDIHARLSAVQLEHERLETALRRQIQEQDAAHMKTREEILGQAAAFEGDLRRRELDVKTLKDQIAQEERTQLEKAREQMHRESGLEERVQFLYKSLEAQKAEHEAQVESADHAYLQQQDALRAQVLQLETDLGRKTTEAADLLARLTQAQVLHNELRESVGQLEARTLDREQALRAAAQTHMDSEHKLEVSITELKAAVQKRDADFAAAEKALHIAQRERQAEASAAAQREKQLEERAQSLDEKLHAQKEQITMRLSGVERQRLQNEETLHTRTLDLEQRLAEKTGLVKSLQDQLNRAGADHEHLEKKMAAVESHLSRADQQLKARETEFQSLKSTTQKEITAAQETHQRKLLELQGQRLSLETDLKVVQEALQHTEEEKKRLTDLRASLEERLRVDAQAHQAALDALQKERMTLEETYQEKLHTVEETLADKINALQALEHRLTLTEEQRADRGNLAELLQKEIHELQLSLAAQQEEFRARLAGFDKERAQLQETQQNRIAQLESQLQYRESALRSLEEKMTLINADHAAIVEAAAERERALAEKTKSLEVILSGQTNEWQTRMEGLLADRMKTETELHARVVNLQETLALREKELIVLKDTLTQTEATHAALSTSSDEAIAYSAKERQSLEERVLQETGRVRDLESQLRGHAVHIKEMEKSLASGLKEREFLQATLEALRRRLDEEIDVRERTHADKTRALESKLETVEREWRDRLDDASKTSVLRVDALQGKVVELECALGVRENDLSALRQNLAEITIERERLADLRKQMQAHQDDFKAKLIAADKEAARQLALLQARASELEKSLALQRAEAEERAALLKSENMQSLETLETRLSQEYAAREKGLHARLLELRDTLAARAAEIQTLSARLRDTEQERAALDLYSTAGHAEATQRREELEKQLAQTREHEQTLETQCTAQMSELQALRSALQDTRKEREQVLQTLAAERAQSTSVLKVEKNQTAAQEKDFRERLAAVHAESSLRQAALQTRLIELEKSVTEKQASLERLAETITHEEAKRAQAEKQWALELESRRAAEALAARQKTDFDAHLAALQAERKQAEDALQARLLELRDTLAARAADIQKLDVQLKETEQARAALDFYSTTNHAEQTRKREALEAELRVERAHAQELGTRLTAQHSELDGLRGALEETQAEREQLLKALAAERQQAAETLKQQKDAAHGSEALLRAQSEAKEKEFRERLAALDRESEKRLIELQTRTSELEKSSAVQRSEFEQRIAFLQAEKTKSDKQLQIQLSELQTQVTLKQAELAAVQSQLAALQKEQQAFEAATGENKKAAAERFKGLQQHAAALEKSEAEKQASLERLTEAIAHEEGKRAQAEKQWAIELESRRAAEALAAQQKTDFDAHIAALQAERKQAEDALHSRLLELRDVLAARAADIQKLEVQLKETEQARAALDLYSTASHAEQTRKREALEGELRSERAHAQELDTRLTAQHSELDGLRGALEETQAEREQLLKALAAERHQAAESLKQQTNAAHGSEALLRAQSEAKEKEFRERLAALDRESEKRFGELQARAAELEKSSAVQRSEFEQRIALLQAEKTKSDKQLQIQLSELQTQVTLKQAELVAVQSQLAAVQKEQQAFEAATGENKKAATERFKSMQQRAAALEKSEAEKQASLERLTEAIAQAESRREHAEKQWAIEMESRRAAEALAVRQKTDFDAHIAALQARLLELRDTLDARASDIRKLDTQLKETEQARATLEHYSAAGHAEHAQKRDALEGDLRTERAHVQELDTELAARQSEFQALRSALEETQAERETLLKALGAERLSAAEARKLEKNTALNTEAIWRSQSEAREKEFRERLAALDQEAEKRLLDLQQRTGELEKNSAAQRVELEQRIAFLQAEKTKSDKQLQIQLTELQSQLILKQADLEAVQNQLSALQKEHHAFEATAGETRKAAAERLKAMQQRMAALETSEAEKQASLDRLRETLVQLEARCAQAEKQWELETQERHSVEALAAVQKKEFEARLAALAEERKNSETGLHQRLLEVRDILAARMVDIQTLEVRLNETEQARAALDHYSTTSGAEAAQRRAALEEQLAGERERAQAVETRLATQVSELKQLQQAFEQARAEREQLLVALAAAREKAAAALKTQETLTAEREAAVRSQMEAQEKEFRLRLAGADKEMERRLSILQARTAELEKALAAQRAEFEQRFALAQAERSNSEKILQAKIADLQAQWTARNAEFNTLEQQLATVQKERDALASASTNQHKAYTEQLDALRTRARELEHASGEKQAAMERLQDAMQELEAHRAQAREQWEKEAQERRAAQEAGLKAQQDFAQSLAAIEAEHRAAEESLHERLLQARTELDQRLNVENDKNQTLSTRLAAQLSELKQLHASLDEARREREELLGALAAEREKSALELKARDTLTTEQKRKYEQRLAAVEKEFRERLAAADAEAARRITLLQARAAELEKALAGEHSDHERQMAAQRSEYEQRLALLQADQSKSEKTLQGTLSDLQRQLTLRTKDVEALQERLAQLQAQRQQWEVTLSAHEVAGVQERQTFEERLSDARNRAAAVELELKTQTAAHHELQDALAAARKDGAALSNMVEEQQKKMQAELGLRETATAEQKKQYEARLAALEKDLGDRLKTAAREASVRLHALQSRAAELEQQGAEKQALLDRLQETLGDLEAKRAHLEAQWVLEAKERHAAQETAAREKEQFGARLSALQAERKAAEAELHQRLLEVSNALATRSAEAERLDRQFKEIVQERAALEQYSTASHGEMTKAHEVALQLLHAERERAQALETRLASQTSELKQLRLSLDDSRAEGERLLAALDVEREKITRELKEKDHLSGEEVARLRAKAELMEKEFRSRLAAVDGEHAQRLSALQSRAAELEKTLMAQRADYEKRLSALQVEAIKTEKTLQAQLSQLQAQLAATAAERDATLVQIAGLDKEKDALKKTGEEQKAVFALRLETLQKSALSLEQDLHAKEAALERLQAALNQLEMKRAHWETQHVLRVQEYQTLQKEADRDKEHFAKQYAELRTALDQRALEVQALEHQRQKTEQAHAALEKKTSLSHADFQKEKQTLELRWSEEKARVQELDLLLKTNVAQIKELKETLFAEQKQLKNSAARNGEYETRMEEWRRRTTELERLGAEKQTALDRLRDALAQAEAKKAQAEHQKEELVLRLETLQSERKTAEDQLHGRLNDLRVQLEHRIQEESSRARDLDSKVHGQAAELEQLRKAFADESQERERLTQTLAAERERALVELKGREKTSTENASQLWTQMEAQEKEFRFQLATLEEESVRRIALLQGRAAELEKALAAQRSEFEQRLHGLQKERSESEEKLHVKIINLEEALNRRIAEAQALHAEFTAVESARAIADESAGSAHGEMVRQQKAFDERLAHEHLQARTLEQELQNYKSQARQWKEALDAGKDDDKKRQALQKRLADVERELETRDQAAGELRKHLASLEEERDRLEIQVQREEEEKRLAVERAQALEGRLEKTRRDDLQAEQKMHAQLVDLSDQLERKGAVLNVLEDRLQQLQKSNEDLSKTLNRDSASWGRQKQELEEKLISERARLRDLEAEQASQKAALRDLQDTLAAAEKERQQAQAALKSQKERFLSDLAQRDSGSAQRHRALELEREALNKEWQERLKEAAQETLERMETLKRRADDLERQLAARQAELKQRHDQVSTLEADRRTLSEQIDSLNRDRKEETDAASAERARLLERARALEERLKEQSHELTAQLESVEETREKTKETLEYRLAQLQEQLTKRTAEVKSAQERLRVVEESRAAVEKEAGQGQSQFTRERAQLEERLAAERGRAKELAGRLNEVTARMQETREALGAAEEAQETQRQKLAAQQESQKALQQRIQALERDAHDGAHAATGDASALERDLVARDAEIERLRNEAVTLKSDMEQRYAAEVEKRVAEKLRDQMMNVLETGKLKNGDSSAMQALLEEWVFGFAHQVRNPLGIIRSVAESLLEGTRRSSERDSLAAILKAVDGLNLRLREFIEFSKPVKPLLQVVDVPSAVAAAVRLLEEKSLPKNIAIESTLPAAGTRIWMDPDHLRTILVQLLRNAVEAMPNGGRVRVAVTFDANRQQLDIRVQDEGSGISNGHMKEVGRPFFSTKPGSVGLGLALIKRLLRAYDGKLDIESRPGHSTTMTCRLKAKIEEAGRWAA